MLTTAMNRSKLFPVAPHWAIGIGILNVAAQPQPCGFFVSNAQPPIMAGWVEQPQGWPGATSVCQLRSVRLPMIGIVLRRVYNSFLKVAIMNTKSNVVSLHPQNNHLPFSIPTPDRALDYQALIQLMPECLETAVSYLLVDFDYEANITSNTAIAIRILAVAAERLGTALENGND